MSAARKSVKRRHKRRAVTAFLVLVLILAGVLLSTTVFFRISMIEVKGTLSQYTKQQVAQASGIELGMNLFHFSAREVEQELWKMLPYLATVSVQRILPGTVVIEVSEHAGSLAVSVPGGVAILSDTLKVLEIALQSPKGAILIKGISAEDPTAGEQLVSADESGERADFIVILSEALQKHNLFEGVVEIDVTDRYNYTLLYESRYIVMIGTENYCDYKISMLAEVVFHRLGDEDVGYLDISTAGRAVFRRGSIDSQEESEDEGQMVAVEILFPE